MASSFYADFHIHSKYSRATSPQCNLENLAVWGRKKGLSVVGTGDFTHPVWFGEIQEKLIPAEPGLFRLKPDLEKAVMEEMPASVREPMRFMLTVEISSIYKKNDKVRKNHNLVITPNLDQAKIIIEKLSRIGNLKSDGRPILGLPSRDLLEIVLEAGDGSYVIPAHVWTPWFSLFGSKSGYDSVEECFEDLSGHIFALETGLSSDPYMNRRVSALDRYRLVSNSDAHSPQKLGREACIFSTKPNFFAMKKALETGKNYEGTLEFFPEEGKYHEDGHRKCDVSLPPWESKKLDGICPKCRKPLTIGVLARVEDLADRPPDYRAKNDAPHDYLIPLPEIIGELMGRGPATKGVSGVFETLIAKLGSEFQILRDLPQEDIRAAGGELLAEAIRRLRQGHVVRQAGFDGEYGVIRVFEKNELSTLRLGDTLFDGAPRSPPKKNTVKTSLKN